MGIAGDPRHRLSTRAAGPASRSFAPRSSASIFGCLVLIARRQAWSWRNAALLTLGAFVVAATALALRPQLLGMALFAVVLAASSSDRDRHPARLWAIPVLVVLWANVHGSFFLAPLVLGLAWLEDVAGACAAAVPRSWSPWSARSRPA